MSEHVSLADQIAYATAKVGHARTTGVSEDEISALRTYCLEFIEKANLSEHTRMMAVPKVEEMIFWIRAGHGRS